ncbi:hypothetical protein GCM10027423_41710 [Spirosoma arcticum]
MTPNQQAIVGGAGLLADAFEKAGERKEQERTSRRFGTLQEKEALLNEAKGLRYAASGNSRFLFLLGGGLGTAIGVSAVSNPANEEPSPWAYVMAVGGGALSLFTIFGIGKDISRRSRAKELERQAKNMQVSFAPVIQGVQSGYTYNGLRIRTRF